MFLPSLFMPGPSTGFQFLMPIKPLSIKLPFGQKLEVEIIRQDRSRRATSSDRIDVHRDDA